MCLGDAIGGPGSFLPALCREETLFWCCGTTGPLRTTPPSRVRYVTGPTTARRALSEKHHHQSCTAGQNGGLLTTTLDSAWFFLTHCSRCASTALYWLTMAAVSGCASRFLDVEAWIFPEPPRPLDRNCFFSVPRRPACGSTRSGRFSAARPRGETTDALSDSSSSVGTFRRRMLPDPPRPDDC